MSEDKGLKKSKMIMISGSSNHASNMARMHELLKTHAEDLKIIFHDLGEVGISATKAGTALRDSMQKFTEVNTVAKDLDFSKCEKIVMDSLTPFYEESAEVTPKALETLYKSLEEPIQPEFEIKPQKEIWANKWNKKIKRKL